MGVEFYMFWLIAISFSTWLTVLTYQFVMHKRIFNTHASDTTIKVNRLDSQVSKLTYTVEDIDRVLKALDCK